MRVLFVLLMLAAGASPVCAQYPPPIPRAPYPDDPERLVASWYRRFLNREPDPVGMAGWIGGLRGGSPPERMLAGILSSDEYYAKAGRTPEGFVRALYRDLLGRAPTEREMIYWMRQMYHQERSDIAYALLMRYPQSWQPRPERADDDDEHHDYRRPFWRYRH